MTHIFKAMLAGGIAMTAVTTSIPASAMPLAAQAAQSAVVNVSGWAVRAEGRHHTYAGPYGYRYNYGYARGPYGGWGYGGYAPPYGGYGRALPPAYGYGGDVYGDY